MKKPKFITEFADIPTKRTKMPELDLGERKLNFDEVELGYTEELARKEAARCLSCRRCIGCGLCLAECDQCALVYEEAGTETKLEADAVVFATDADVFDAGRKRELGYRDSANVITSHEFERLASPAGPFGGMLVRPFDGEVPKRIAFIQCVGSREEAIGAAFCSVECCTRTLSQAARARQLAGDVKVSVFHKGLRPVGKRAELDLRRLTGEEWIDFVECAVTSVAEDRDSGEVAVRYQKDGKDGEGKFDLVVLAVGFASKRDWRKFARPGGVATNKFGFVDRSIKSILAMKDGVAYAGSVLGPCSAETAAVDAIGGGSRALGACCDGSDSVVAPPGEALVFACEYGLSLAGKDKAFVEDLTQQGVRIAGAFAFLCYKDGRAAMKRDAVQGSSLVVIGCHPGSHERLFETVLGLPKGGVVILGRGDLEGALKERIGSASGRSPRPSASRNARRPQHAVILGGGISGLAAASELARRGVKTTVVEGSEAIGGRGLEGLDSGRAGDAEAMQAFISAAEANPNLAILKSAEALSVARVDGSLEITVNVAGREQKLDAGALVIATGAGEYVPDDYGYGKSDAVLLQRDFAARMRSGEVPWKRIIMIQCVGARDDAHPYCSRYCCRDAVANALQYKRSLPDSDVVVLHKGVRVYGAEEETYLDAIDGGVKFIQTEAKPSVSLGTSTKVSFVAGGKPALLECDALVLSNAHRHGGEQERIAAITGASLDRLGFFEVPMPASSPFGTDAEGVFVCGFARTPLAAEECFSDGLGVAGAVCRYLSD